MAVDDSRARSWSMGPLAVCAAAFGLSTGAWAVVALLLLAAMGAWWVRRGPTWSSRVQLLTGGAATAVALLAGPVGAPEVVFPPGGTEPLHPLAARMALAFLAVTVLRRYLHEPFGGIAATLLALAASLAASGFARWNATYSLLAALFALTSIPTLVASPGGGPAWSVLDPRRKVAVAAMVIAAAGVAAGLVSGIPLLHRQLVGAFLAYDGARSESGLTDSILLGGATDITESDEVVLRIQGGSADYLRGFVLSRYRNGAWLPSEQGRGAEESIESAPASREARVEVRSAKTEPRFYLPLQAKRVATASGRVVIDRMGLLRSISGEAADVAWFEPGERERWPVAPPQAEDSVVPDTLRPALQRLVTEWTAGAVGTQEKLRRIESKLRAEFRYSLQHERRTNADPVLDFLLVHRVGHCEYFASAMALLSRTAGVPARVVSGYRVQETNPLGGYQVVRARDAHAWVEAWVDGVGWVTWDPTPPSALAALRPSTTPLFGSLADAAADLWQRAARSDVARPRNLALGAGVATGLAAAAVWLKRRRRRQARIEPTDTASSCYPALAAVIAARGHVRSHGETLEAFAERVRHDASDAAFGRDASGLIEDYARWRYGGLGDLRDIERRIRGLGADSTSGLSYPP